MGGQAKKRSGFLMFFDELGGERAEQLIKKTHRK